MEEPSSGSNRNISSGSDCKNISGSNRNISSGSNRNNISGSDCNISSGSDCNNISGSDCNNIDRINIKEDFAVVFETQFSGIYNYIYARILHHERTEDLVSEVFIKAMKHYNAFNPAIASVKTWLTNIARNTLIDEFRKAGRAQVYSLDAETEYIEPSEEDAYPIMQNPVNNEARAILQKLSDSERELIAMIYYEGLSNPEIGEILGINAKAVSERHRRLLAKCRKLEAGKRLEDFL